MVLLQDLSEWLQADDPEERQMITGVDWHAYQALLNDLEDNLQYRVAYLDGVLELVSPSRRHERHKTLIGSLLEDYFKEKRIRFFPFGSTTLRNAEKRSGAEPDESYCIHTEKAFPDLAIEVVITSGSVNKLEVYRRLGVQEIWFFKNNQFEVHSLRQANYEQIAQSEMLPGLDLALLAQSTIAADPLTAAIEFRAKLRAMK